MSAQQESPQKGQRAVVVAAATRLLREEGAEAVTTRAVAQAAGVQAPTIYRLFGDKNGLVDAVAEQVMADYVASKAAAAGSATGDPVAELAAAWRLHMEFGLANPELYALIGARGRGAPSPATAAGIAVLRGHVRRLAAAGRLGVDEQRALLMIHAAGQGTVLALLGLPEQDRDPGLADAMFDAVLSRITTTAAAVPDPSRTSLTVAFATAVPDLPGLTGAERTVLAEWLDRSLQQPPVS